MNAENLASLRDRWISVRELQAADQQLIDAAQKDDELRRDWRLARSRWIKTWNEELRPFLFFCRHVNAVHDGQYRLTEENTEGCDVILRADREIQLEITTAYAMHVPGVNPGYQEALRSEKLETDGHVSANALLVRNGQSKLIEYGEPDISRSLSDLALSWAEGLDFALRRKQRLGYGSGKTLIVYGDGLSGDFEHIRQRQSLCDVVARMHPECWQNGFDRTAIVGWHPGWIFYPVATSARVMPTQSFRTRGAQSGIQGA